MNRYNLKVSNPRLRHEYGRGMLLSLEVDAGSLAEAQTLVDDLQRGYIALAADRWSPDKSLSANAYCWALIDKIALATRQNRTDVYKQVIREIGGNSEQRRIRSDALAAWKKVWESNGTGWVVEIGAEAGGWVDTINYYGSSAYDARQLSRLIDSVEAEARNLGIPLTERNRVNQWPRV